MVHEDWALAAVRDVTKAWNCRDWAAFESLHRHDVVYESPHHPPVAGRRAVVRRSREIVALVPDIQTSALRMTGNDRVERCATFEYLQSGTLAEVVGPFDERGPACPFEVHTTMHVRFDDDGRIAALTTSHR